MTLNLVNNTTKKSYSIDFSDTNSSSLYYKGDITLPEKVKDGEYSYELIDENNNVVATGLLQIGDYKNENVKFYGK